MIQTSCISDDRLRSLLLGELSDEDAAPLESHLLECPACVARTRSLRSSDTLIAALQHTKNRKLLAAQSSSIDKLVQRLSDRSQLGTHPSLFDATVAPGAKGNPRVQDLIALLEPAAGPDELGRLGSFRVLKLLGRGGMGAVFLAEDLQLRRHVALKLLRPDRGSDAESVERFMREARAAAAVRHDHVVTIYQVGEVHGIPFITQELLEGETLEDRLKRNGRLPIAEALRIGREIALGLAAAHHRGLLHRDIKPSNIWLEAKESGTRSQEPVAGDQKSSPCPQPLALSPSDSRVKLLDFGLARSQQGDEQLTQAGTVVGTPAYMSPEQAASQPLDARSDLFSLGGVLYRMVTGRLPFQGTDTLSMLRSLAVDQPPSARSLNSEIPAELSDLISQLLAKDVENRPQSADIVAQTLASLENHRTSPQSESKPASALLASRRLWIALGASAAATLLCGIIITITHRDGTKTKIEVEGDANVEIVTKSSAATPTDATAALSSKPTPTRGASASAMPQALAGADSAAAVWALRIGGTLTIDSDGTAVDTRSLEELPTQPFQLTTLKLGRRPLRDLDLTRLAGLKHLESLELNDTGLTDAALIHLEGLPALNHLTLVNDKITDAAFDSLAKLPALRRLSITGTKTTSAGWQRLRELPKLAEMHVAMLPFADSDLAELVTAQPELETLNLWGTAVTDAGTPHLVKLSQLKLLHLNFTKVTGRGLAPIAKLHHLEFLDLPAQMPFADEGAKHLSALAALRSLTFQTQSFITDEGLLFLARIKSLRELKLGGARVTGVGLADLADLPQLHTLQLTSPDLTQEGAGNLARLPSLAGLELGEVQSDQALAALCKSQSLAELHLAGSKLTDDGLLALTALKHLKTVVVRGIRASPATLERLKSALPDAEIQINTRP